MSKSKTERSIPRFSAFSIALALTYLINWCGCNASRSYVPPTRIKSPNGNLTIVPDVINGIVGMKVVDASGAEIFDASTEASDRMRWQFQWEGDETIVFTSSDIGTIRWARNPAGEWNELRM